MTSPRICLIAHPKKGQERTKMSIPEYQSKRHSIYKQYCFNGLPFKEAKKQLTDLWTNYIKYSNDFDFMWPLNAAWKPGKEVVH